MLGSICAVTITVPDLLPVEQAYTEFLGMRVVWRGLVPRGAAESWGAPEAAGCRLLVLAPELGEETCLRFVEDPKAGMCRPFVTFGWNATEFTVRDTDALAARLAGSPFRIIGPPANLKGFDWIRAMQVLGPSGECLYLTDVGGDETLAQPMAAVGQVFIAVAGGPDMGAMTTFYDTHFRNEISAPVRVPIGVVNRAHGLPPNTRHGLALLKLPDGTRVELDEYPSSAVARPLRPGHLPPGMAMVSFRADRLPDKGLLTAPAPVGLPPFPAARSACLPGGAGELIEIFENR
jgi:catechol 2,3-dioxygenase-like lactoylglutathione lyase family enzyme